MFSCEAPNLLSHPTVGVQVVGLTNNVPVRLSSSCEELPVGEVISRANMFLGLKRRSLVGFCERMPSNSCIG